MLEVLKAVWGEVCKVPILGVTPYRLDWIEVRGIRGQPFDDNATMSSYPGLDPRCPMRLPSVPDEREATGQMSPQPLKKTQNLFTANVLSMLSPVKTVSFPTGRNRDRADGREPVAAVPLAKDRRLTSRRPCTPYNRLKHEAALIQEHDASAGSLGVFLYAATVFPAIAQWRPRRAPGHAVPVSDNSIPRPAGSSKREQGGSELQRCAR
jgi:hypothetical protein